MEVKKRLDYQEEDAHVNKKNLKTKKLLNYVLQAVSKSVKMYVLFFIL